MTAARIGAVAAVLASVLAGCSSSSSPLAIVSAQQTVDGLHGDVLQPPVKEPHIVLTDTSGTKFNLAKQTAGRVSLVYFGYTHCPDICPTIMADTAQALRQSSAAVRRDVSVAFITVDPHRDTLPVLRRWLNHFNPTFIGLRGTIRQVIAIQKAADVPTSKIDPHSKHGYTVEHSAELLAFTPDHLAHVLYTEGPTTISDIQHDLTVLTTNKTFGS
jgi:protein SCO1/2